MCCQQADDVFIWENKNPAIGGCLWVMYIVFYREICNNQVTIMICVVITTAYVMGQPVGLVSEGLQHIHELLEAVHKYVKELHQQEPHNRENP